MSHADTQSITGTTIGQVLIEEGKRTCAMNLPIDPGVWYHFKTETLLSGHGKVWRVGLNEPKGLGVPASEGRRSTPAVGEVPDLRLRPDAPAHENPEQR